MIICLVKICSGLPGSWKIIREKSGQIIKWFVLNFFKGLKKQGKVGEFEN